MRRMSRCITSFVAIITLFTTSFPLHAQHDHGSEGPQLAPPKVFLDKSPRVVAYQLQRLDNRRLLMVDRKTDDKKYIPVYQAILTRVGMSPEFREEALAGLAALQNSNPITILLDAIGSIDANDPAQRSAADPLAKMLVGQPINELKRQADRLKAALESNQAFLSSVAAAGLIVSGQGGLVTANPNATMALLQAIPLVPSRDDRAALHQTVVKLLTETASLAQQNAAIIALGSIDNQQDKTFELVAPLVTKTGLRDVAVETLLTIPRDKRPPASCESLIANLVVLAQNTPTEQRTSDSFIDAMQLADQLLAHVPVAKAKEYRSQLDAVSVRVIRIKTVEEEMRYDLPYFAVESGKAVQIVISNEDMMPHNLVITTSGSLKEVVQLGLEAGPRGIDGGFPYVPKSEKVLHATNMINAREQQTLTFTAPIQPGEYPYVCTFPQHWYRMYGVMVVVEDLDQWLKNPVEPSNPIGSNRSFVQAWTVDDLKDELAAGLQGRSLEIGKRIFVEASCAGCHKFHGEGGSIGPELTDVVQRWKGDRVAILKEILEPSHKVDAQYAMQKVLTADGQVINGILIKEDADKITLMVSPDAKEPTVIDQDDIEQMTPSAASIMPKALLDQYTKDEIYELLAYLESMHVH